MPLIDFILTNLFNHFYIASRAISKSIEIAQSNEFNIPSYSHLITRNCVKYMLKKNNWVRRKATKAGRRAHVNINEVKSW